MDTKIILLGVLIISIFYVVFVFNTLTHLRQKVREAWADIDVQLKRRQELIPSLITTVKAYAQHEESLFTRITSLRSQIQQTTEVAQIAGIENEMEQALRQLLSVAEAYPELQASARRIYNNNVSQFNTKVSIFPTNMFARLFGFVLLPFFQNDAAS